MNEIFILSPNCRLNINISFNIRTAGTIDGERDRKAPIFLYRKNKWNPCWVNNVIMVFRVGSMGPSRAKAVKSRFIIRLIVRRVRERNRNRPRCLCCCIKRVFLFRFSISPLLFLWIVFVCSEAPKGAGGETVARVSKVARFWSAWNSHEYVCALKWHCVELFRYFMLYMKQF